MFRRKEFEAKWKSKRRTEKKTHSHQSIQVHPSYKLDSLFKVLCKHTLAHTLNEDNSESTREKKMSYCNEQSMTAMMLKRWNPHSTHGDPE